MTAVLALSASLLWGLADFGGGLLTRRAPALMVVVISQAAAAVVLGVAVLGTGALAEGGPRLWYAVGAGVIGPVVLWCFYRALALGPMGVVSPLATVGVAVPIGVGLIFGDRPGLAQAAGILLALTGVVLAGGPQLRGAPVQREAILLTLVAAVGFGATMTFIAEAFTTTTGLLLALFVQRVCNVLVGGVLMAVSKGPSATWDGGLRGLVGGLPMLAAVGLADVAANGGYALATSLGSMTVAAVLASLYPVLTALLARGVLSERLRPVQAAGAGLALAGTILLAAG